MAAQEGAAGTANQVVVRSVRYGDVGDSNFALHDRAVPLLVGLLALVVSLVVVCLYLHWACGGRRRRRQQADLEASSSSAAAASPGLDADAISGLPVTLYSPPRTTTQKGGGEEEERDAECSICISALAAGDKVKSLPPYGHCFHPDCVDAWLRSHASCPLCRTLLLPKATASAKPDASVVAVNGIHSPSPV